MRMIKIISGGQTGVDRAALDAAVEQGVDYGGSVPRGRLAEDGPIAMRYGKLIELESEDYRARTLKNVMDADATLIFTEDKPAGGTALTVTYALEHSRPFKVIDLREVDALAAVSEVRSWIEAAGVATLNVAGPRESGSPGIYEKVKKILGVVLEGMAES